VRVISTSREEHVEEKRRLWTAPAVTTFGSFDAATQACIKDFGSSDGFTFQGVTVPIHWCAS
jgi:hypothetical protein